MITIYSGAAILLAGATATGIVNHRVNERSIASFLDKAKKLSPSAESDLDEVCGKLDPPDGQVRLSRKDVWAIFWNSRLYLCVANRARLFLSKDEELTDIFHIIHRYHRKLRWLIFMTIIEQIVGKLGLGRFTMYHRMILWTYGVELDLIEDIKDKIE